MKKLIGFLFLMILTTSLKCQEDKVFKEQITVEKGIKFGDGTIQLTAPTGGQIITWATLTGKPATFPPDAHNHSTLYKSISYVPTWAEITGKPSTFTPATHTHAWIDITGKPDEVDLATAISSLQVLVIPKLTTAQIASLTPTSGSLVYDVTLNVLKIGNGTVFKTLITNQ